MGKILNFFGTVALGILCAGYSSAAEKIDVTPKRIDTRLVYCPQADIEIECTDKGADGHLDGVIDKDWMRINRVKKIRPEDHHDYEEIYTREVAIIHSRLFKTPKQQSWIGGIQKDFYIDIYLKDGSSISYVDFGLNGLDKVIGSNGVVLVDRKHKDFRFHEDKFKQMVHKLYLELPDVKSYREFMERN